MKLSNHLKLEIKLHKVFVLATLPAAVLFALGFSLPLFADVPLWAKLAFGTLCLGLFYAWWRRCLSPDKTRFTPRIWK